jgi:hypothetical protein
MLLNRQVHMRSPMASNVMVAFCVSSSCLRHVIYVLGSACTCLRSISISLSLSLSLPLFIWVGACVLVNLPSCTCWVSGRSSCVFPLRFVWGHMFEFGVRHVVQPCVCHLQVFRSI